MSDISTELLVSLRHLTTILSMHGVPEDHIDELIRHGLVERTLGGFRATPMGKQLLIKHCPPRQPFHL